MATIMKAIPTRPAKAGKLAGVSPNVLLLRNELRAGAMETVATLTLGSRTIDICTGADSLWAIIRRPRRGGLALRVAHAPGGCGKLTKKRGGSREATIFELETSIGLQTIAVQLHENEIPILRVTTSITPHVPLLIPFLPRDLYPLGDE